MNCNKHVSKSVEQSKFFRIQITMTHVLVHSNDRGPDQRLFCELRNLQHTATFVSKTVESSWQTQKRKRQNSALLDIWNKFVEKICDFWCSDIYIIKFMTIMNSVPVLCLFSIVNSQSELTNYFADRWMCHFQKRNASQATMASQTGHQAAVSVKYNYSASVWQSLVREGLVD